MPSFVARLWDGMGEPVNVEGDITECKDSAIGKQDSRK